MYYLPELSSSPVSVLRYLNFYIVIFNELNSLSLFFIWFFSLLVWESPWTRFYCFLDCKHSNQSLSLLFLLPPPFHEFIYFRLSKGLNRFWPFGCQSSWTLLGFLLFGFLYVWFCRILVWSLLLSVFIL